MYGEEMNNQIKKKLIELVIAVQVNSGWWELLTLAAQEPAKVNEHFSRVYHQTVAALCTTQKARLNDCLHGEW